MFQRKADVMRVYQHLTQVFQRRKVIFSCGINFGISVVVGEVCFLQILQVDAQLVDLIHHIQQRHFGGILAVVSAVTGQLSAGRVPQSYRAIVPPCTFWLPSSFKASSASFWSGSRIAMLEGGSMRSSFYMSMPLCI